MLGDPHITTLDGYKVTFNGWGEYILLQAPEFMLQGRVEQIVINGVKKDATYITELAMRELTNPIVQMKSTNTNELGKINFLLFF